MEFDRRLMDVDPDIYRFTGDDFCELLEKCGLDEAMVASHMGVSTEQVKAWKREGNALLPPNADTFAKAVYASRHTCIIAIMWALEEALNVELSTLEYSNKKLFSPIIDENELCNSTEELQFYRVFCGALRFVELTLAEKGFVIEHIALTKNFKKLNLDNTRMDEYGFMLEWVGRSIRNALSGNKPYFELIRPERNMR